MILESRKAIEDATENHNQDRTLTLLSCLYLLRTKVGKLLTADACVTEDSGAMRGTLPEHVNTHH